MGMGTTMDDNDDVNSSGNRTSGCCGCGCGGGGYHSTKRSDHCTIHDVNENNHRDDDDVVEQVYNNSVLLFKCICTSGGCSVVVVAVVAIVVVVVVGWYHCTMIVRLVMIDQRRVLKKLCTISDVIDGESSLSSSFC